MAVAAVIMAAAGVSAAAATSAWTPAGPGSTLYVDNQISGTVTPISTATNRPGKPIRLPGGFAYGAAMTPDGKTLYVANASMPGLVTPISTATNKPGKPIKVSSNPQFITTTPNGKTAYVADVSSGTVTPITVATNKPGKSIKTGNTPWAIVCAPEVCRYAS